MRSVYLTPVFPCSYSQWVLTEGPYLFRIFMRVVFFTVSRFCLIGVRCGFFSVRKEMRTPWGKQPELNTRGFQKGGRGDESDTRCRPFETRQLWVCTKLGIPPLGCCLCILFFCNPFPRVPSVSLDIPFRQGVHSSTKRVTPCRLPPGSTGASTLLSMWTFDSCDASAVQNV